MDENTYKARVARLEAIGKILDKLPAEIRAAAFTLLQGYVTGISSKGGKPESTVDDVVDEIAPADASAFFSKHTHEKPADNLKSVAAFLFSQYGAEPFSMDEVRTVADDVGLTIPERPDMTFVNALGDGKKLFARGGRGEFRPTVHGETFFKTTYSVKKGTKRRVIANK